LDDRGGLTAASASWTSANTWSTGIGTSTPDMLMMDGYLDDGDGGNVTVSVSGLPATFTASGYDVYVYCDGDNGGSARTGGYTIGSTTVDALDPANTNFSGTYTQASNSAGNYVVLPNQTASSFTLTAAPVSSADGVMRAPVNAVQIVAHQPEFAVTIKSVSTGTPLGETMAALGARPYVDNGAMVTGIKNVLGGGILVRTAYKDRLVPAASSYLTLTLSAPGTVYVCYNNLQPLPAWLKDGTWTPTSNLVYLGSNIFQAYAKTVPAGDITLGGNLAASATAANFCYFVIAQPQEGEPGAAGPLCGAGQWLLGSGKRGRGAECGFCEYRCGSRPWTCPAGIC
jgi:hypothetical protein